MADVILAADAPAALGPYSQALRHGEWLFLSGQLGIDPATGALPPSAAAQTAQVMRNLAAVLAAAGSSLAQLVKVTIYLTDLREFEAVNQVYAAGLAPPYPARATVQVSALPKGALVEIDGIALLSPAHA